MKDMISLFKDIAVADTSLNAVMVDSFEKEEDGLDNSGVFLDALSAFWNSFYDYCALMAKMREFQSSVGGHSQKNCQRVPTSWFFSN